MNEDKQYKFSKKTRLKMSLAKKGKYIPWNGRVLCIHCHKKTNTFAKHV